MLLLTAIVVMMFIIIWYGVQIDLTLDNLFTLFVEVAKVHKSVPRYVSFF